MNTEDKTSITQQQLSYIGIYKLSTLMLGSWNLLSMMGGCIGFFVGVAICVALEENFQGGFPEEAHALIIFLSVLCGMVICILTATYTRIKRFQKDLRQFVEKKSDLDPNIITMWLD